MILQGKIEHLIKTKKGVLHVGANVGEERFWYKEQGFSQVLWFEANSLLIPELEANLSDFPNQKAIPFGIHDTLQSATLHISNNRGQSSSILELGTHKKHHPNVFYIQELPVRLRRMDYILKMLPVSIEDFNFVNIDVQGVELNVLKSFGNLLGNIQYIYTEVNTEQVYKDCSLIGDIDTYLRDFGFTREETYITKANWGDALYINKKI